MKYKSYNNLTFKKSDYYLKLPDEEREVFDILSHIFHFKVNTYVLERLINWENVPHDPIYQLVFLRKEMLTADDYEQLKLMYQTGMPQEALKPFMDILRRKMAPVLNQSPNVFPEINGEWVRGLSHNFGTIISLYPAPMTRTCHAYCNYCFRWIMFDDIGMQNELCYTDPLGPPIDYIKAHPEVTDVLFTGADTMVVKADKIKQYLDPVLEIDSVKVIRFGTKSLGWWPFRFTTDADADNILELFEYIVSKGKHLNICAHFTHVRELQTPEVCEAIQRIQRTGATIRCQGPIVKGINDTVEDWVDLWDTQIALGLIPYYMFVEADHNTESCFRIPLAKALHIYQEARKRATTLAKTCSGPVFMNDQDRVLIDGVLEIGGQKHFVLKSLQSPPNTNGAGKIRLIPYDKNLMDAGDLFALFNEEESMYI